MTFAPVAPTTRVAPEQVAKDTWVVHHTQEALGQPLFVYLNSMIIKGSEPVILDTGTIGNREQWLDDVFGLVDPADVRWVFISHDDIDHTGNLDEVLTACPNATLVCSWAILERHSNAFNFPLDRCRWVNDGESFDVGDRELLAVRPPLWDSPTTRGLFDRSTGVYWGVDSFACPMPGEPMSTVDELPPDFWGEGMAMFMYHALSPWLGLVDEAKFTAHCNHVQSLGMSTIATAHSPIINEGSIERAFEITRELPNITPPPCPDQTVLEAVLAGASA
ncbi:MAG: oxygen-binding di-iron domain-containing protein [Acidimicrobiia bacterium]